MLIEDVYLIYLNKAEKNLTNDAKSTDRGRFTILWNNQQLNFLDRLLQMRGSDDIRQAQVFLKIDKPLEKQSESKTSTKFKLPQDFFDIGDVQAFATKDNCKNQKLFLYETSPENYTEYLRNNDTKPDFLWRESIFSLSSDSVEIFQDNFTIEKALMSYYRQPNKIQLIDEQNPESDFDEDIIIEWDDKSIYKIIDMCVIEFDISANSNRLNADALRLNQ